MRVVQGGDGAGLALEAPPQVGIRSHMLGQHLDGDGAVQTGVRGPVDFAHATSAEGAFDPIGTERGAG